MVPCKTETSIGYALAHERKHHFGVLTYLSIPFSI
ncbi:hypothetical protein BSY240_4689 (plasmid) [Agrobacterium sp. RAC06]|nr:hypothetical protein BSY240_4689 [Agrobacterium sp. RAC06]